MILKEEPKEKLWHFFNKDLFPLMNKYAIKDLEQDYFDFSTVIQETNIIKSRSYKNAWTNACKIFMDGISLCFEDLFTINDDKKNSSEYEIYCRNKENFAKDVNILYRFEKVINEYYETYKINKYCLYEPEKKYDIFNEKGNIDLEEEPLESGLYSENLDENSDIFSSKMSFPNNNHKNEAIFENKKFFINKNSYNTEKNNNLKINNNNNVQNNKKEIIFSTNHKNDLNQKKISNFNYSKLKHCKYDHRKKKIKEFKFRKIKRENVDKKILRKFKKFLKHRLREKTENEVKNYINNNQFWPDYISENLMPPFSYDKEKISFKSFNTKYLCWFFEHKYSQELFNIFINKNYNDLISLIKEAYNLKEDTDDYNLLKIYLNTMPNIYGNENTRSTAFSSHIAESDAEDIKNNDEKEKENNDMYIDSSENDKDNNDINLDLITSNINMNINDNVNNSNINEENNINFINNNNYSYINNYTEMNIEPNDKGENNNICLDNSFEKENQNTIKFDKNIFNII